MGWDPDFDIKYGVGLGLSHHISGSISRPRSSSFTDTKAKCNQERDSTGDEFVTVLICVDSSDGKSPGLIFKDEQIHVGKEPDVLGGWASSDTTIDTGKTCLITALQLLNDLCLYKQASGAHCQ